jgi:hypothetical protein
MPTTNLFGDGRPGNDVQVREGPECLHQIWNSERLKILGRVADKHIDFQQTNAVKAVV